MLDPLPHITPEHPGIGGQLKAEPAHFVVEEVPLYEASGQGSHLFVSLTREGWTTRRVVEQLARLYGLKVQDIGYAGLKDRQARCTQTFSLPGLSPDDARRIEAELPFQVNWARQHTNKLKLGHLLGNRFQITVTGLDLAPNEVRTRAEAIAAELAVRGLPNFFGAQRFGFEGGNVAKGRDAILGLGPRRDKWLHRLLVSAYQSHLFNRYLARRMALGQFECLMAGDVCKKTDTGGMFEVLDVAAEQPRYARGEITFTGPLFGKKMWPASGPAGELEALILAEAELTADDWRRAHVEGTRRVGRLRLPAIDLAVAGAERTELLTPAAGSLQVAFMLPKGAYATVVLREFTKSDEGADQFADEADE